MIAAAAEEPQDSYEQQLGDGTGDAVVDGKVRWMMRWSFWDAETGTSCMGGFFTKGGVQTIRVSLPLPMLVAARHSSTVNKGMRMTLGCFVYRLMKFNLVWNCPFVMGIPCHSKIVVFGSRPSMIELLIPTN